MSQHIANWPIMRLVNWAGKELFRGLGPMRRIVSVQIRENRASLMVAPSKFQDRAGSASLSR